jgi:hypothetical protein
MCQQRECSYDAVPHSRRISIERAVDFPMEGQRYWAPSAHYITNEEWNYIMLYMYMNMEEVQPYFDMFNKIYWK